LQSIKKSFIKKEKKMYKLILLVSAILLSSCSSTGTKQPTTTYVEDPYLQTQNPDRGFYLAEELTKEREYNIFEDIVDEGLSLAYASIFLEDYLYTETLPNSLLEIIDNNLQDAKKLNIKIILRIKYRDSDGVDPTHEIALSHLNQLRSVLQANKETISVIQAGVIGRWGEWHGFSDEYALEAPNHKEYRKEIVETLHSIFPDKYIQLRTPTHKEYLYGSSTEYKDKADDAKITEDIAFSDDILAHIGQHDDCFLYNETNNGTYPSDEISFWRDYVKNDSKYSPLGGETCGDNEAFTNCEYALNELKEMQYSYLNESYHPDVIQRWKDEGCYETIKLNLGYRIVAEALYLNSSNDKLDIELELKNKGFAAPYTTPDITLILEDINGSKTYNYPLDSYDIRKMYPDTTFTVSEYITTSGLNLDHYCLYLQIGDTNSSIMFSNENMWSEEFQANKLICQSQE
jgi:hypothetical protein